MFSFENIKDCAELLSFLTSPILAFFAWKMLEQLKLGSEQVKVAAEQIVTSKKISEIQAKREAMKIAAEQATYFSEKIIPDIDAFLKLKEQNKYPILSRVIVIEDWPNIESKTDDIHGLIKELSSNNGLVIKTLNKIEGFAMYFACGVADANMAYRPLCVTYCSYIKNFLPFILAYHDQFGQYSNTLFLYGAWGTRNHIEKSEKEISRHKEHLSKITIPDVKPYGCEIGC